LLQRLRGYFAKARADVIAAWLFGSRARGAARADSDVDIAVLVRPGSAGSHEALAIKLQLENELDALLHSEPDVTIVNAAPVDLVHRILRDGVLLLERDRAERVRFEVTSRADYFDLVPVLQRYRRYRGVEP